MKLSQYLDVELLRAHLAAGDVTERAHPAQPRVKIYNYSKTHAYQNSWTDVTRRTRGLIWDEERDRVLAIPFLKFFNRGERPEEEPPEAELPEAVFDKRDGSLGIVWHSPDTDAWDVATRGSFASEQAEIGRELLARAASADRALYPSRTYLVEIVSPDTRIVVDYRGREGLDLLGVIDRETGREVPLGRLTPAERSFWELAGEPSYPLPSGVLTSASASPRGFDAEGYVLLYADGTRLKVKHEDYVRLHRIMTGLSSRDVWRHLGATLLRADDVSDAVAARALGVEKSDLAALDVARLRAEVPEEMHAWLDATQRTLLETVERALRPATDLTSEHRLGELSDRRERALLIKRLAGSDRLLESLLFAPTDGARLAIAWRSIKPERETFREDES